MPQQDNVSLVFSFRKVAYMAHDRKILLFPKQTIKKGYLFGRELQQVRLKYGLNTRWHFNAK